MNSHTFLLLLTFLFKVAAQAGQNVTLVDVSPDVLAKAQKSIGANLGRVAKKVYKDDPQAGEKFVTESLGRIKTLTDAGEAAKSADLVVEAIVENMAVKHKLFKQLDEVRPWGIILKSIAHMQFKTTKGFCHIC